MKRGQLPKGSVLTVSFELAGQVFTALNGDPPSSSPTPFPSW